MIDLTKYKKGAKFVTRNGYKAELLFAERDSSCFFFRIEYEHVFYHELYVAYNKHGQEAIHQSPSWDIVEELKI